jgi:tRNA threonylcarbamoyladenosine biosynthesis protein TsaB
MLTLAFDTATSVATSALVRDGEVVAERASRAVRVLADADELLTAAGAQPRDLTAVVAGTGPGSFTGLRIGLAAARALAFALELPLAGVSTLEALAAGAPGAVPVIDAGRREVFSVVDGTPVVLSPQELTLEAGATVRDAVAQLRSLPGGELLPSVPLVAINLSYSSADARLEPGDELAVIPPVAGG